MVVMMKQGTKDEGELYMNVGGRQAGICKRTQAHMAPAPAPYLPGCFRITPCALSLPCLGLYPPPDY